MSTTGDFKHETYRSKVLEPVFIYSNFYIPDHVPDGTLSARSPSSPKLNKVLTLQSFNVSEKNRYQKHKCELALLALKLTAP